MYFKMWQSTGKRNDFHVEIKKLNGEATYRPTCWAKIQENFSHCNDRKTLGRSC